MSDKDSAPLVPKLRFADFQKDGGWTVKSFDELFTVGNGRDYKQLDIGEVPVYGSGGYMLSVSDHLHDGESVCIGRKGTINNPMFLSGRFWTVDTLFYTHSFKECLPKFIWAIFQKINWLEHNEAGGVPSLSKTNIQKIQTAIPKLAEQQKIADCLSSLDELIAAQARKVDALKTHKKGLMQQLFPREGETQPRLRFPEFQNADDWTLNTLENLCGAKISYGIVQAGPHISGGMPYIKSSDLNSNISLDTLSRTSEKIAEKYRRSEVLPGDLVFSLRGNIGVCKIVPDEISVANLTQGTARLRTKGPADFFLQLLQSQPVNDRILAASKGSTFQEISLGGLRAIPMVIPEIDEQRRIADCLTGLDYFISVQTQALETLKTQKRGLMQQLFPSAEAVDA